MAMILPAQTPVETFSVKVSQLTPSTQVSSPADEGPVAVPSQLPVKGSTGPDELIVPDGGLDANDDGSGARRMLKAKVMTTNALKANNALSLESWNLGKICLLRLLVFL